MLLVNVWPCDVAHSEDAQSLVHPYCGAPLRLLSGPGSEILLVANPDNLQSLPRKPMRSFILSVSADRWLTPIRNTVLAHAGYAVIPAYTADAALQVLLNRHVSAMLIGQSIPVRDQRRLSSEGRRLGIPSVILDRSGQTADSTAELHVDPSDGPEAFLSAIASALQKRSLS